MAEVPLTGVDHRTKRRVILGQLRPANTTAASLYSPATNVTALVEFIMICNTTAGGLTYRLFIDNDGTTYDETTALAFDKAIAANANELVELQLPMIDDAGNIGVRTSSNNGLTFTAWGYELIGANL